MQICLNRTPYFDLGKQYSIATSAIAERIYAFHQSLPHYQATPLVSLNALAQHLNIGGVWVKDESQRFDLNAFKILGASYAIAHCLAEHIGLETKQLDYATIAAHQSDYQNLTLVTATDGNHGRAVAWAAQKFGCKAMVFLPAGAHESRLTAIQKFGAMAQILELTYDQTVAHAAQVAQTKDRLLIQDTSWPGYQKIPQLITQGYFTLLSEAFSQLSTHQLPTHIFIQAGVGSLPAALVAHCRSIAIPQPFITVVEPNNADCLLRSIQQNEGQSTSITGHLNTIMAGLACGTPSQDALAILRTSADAFMACSDEVAKRGMRVLGNPLHQDCRIVSGESGAVTLGALYEVCTDPQHADVRQLLNLQSDSRVLLFSTEGDTAPHIYRDIVW